MIELLLAATFYGRVFTPSNTRLAPFRHVLAPGCFAELLHSRPPFLALDHRVDVAYGSMVRADDRADRLTLTMRTAAPEIVGAIRRGWTPECSVAWKPFDVEWFTDDEGDWQIVHSAHLYEVSLVGRGAMRGAGPIAWREVR